MEKELFNFISENKLSPFNLYKTPVKAEGEGIFKTKDSKSVHNRVLNKIANCFCFSDTANLLSCFHFIDNPDKIKERQEFFMKIPKNLENGFLKALEKPRASWKPKYGVIAATDNEDSFKELKNLEIPVKFLLNEEDAKDLENYDIVQAVDVEEFVLALEQLPQSVFIDSIEDVYLERYLEMLSGWKNNLDILEIIEDSEIKKVILELKPVLELIDLKAKEKISRDEIETRLEKINEEIFEKIKEMNVSGESIFKMLNENKLPKELRDIVDDSIEKSNVPEYLFELTIPVKINEQEFKEFTKLLDANENTDFAEKIKRNSVILKKVPEKLERLSALILFYDFISGISEFIGNKENWPVISDRLKIENAENLFLENPQKISFYLNENEKCSILTGANSGGKTTLIEHVIQVISLFNLGLPIEGKAEIPIFSEVYYFAKNKGSASKGAFENLLVQMSKIKPGKKTLILADEIESVTEPGVAGKIIAATSKYFIEKNCFLIIATHLGQEIIKVLPEKARIDGIEAKGLNEENELIVNHNPVIGRLASSTPELIVEKMANSKLHEYFEYLNEYLKSNNYID
jgi:DNA mismatch repair protein MutS2